jgi:acyl-CoA thioesterase
MQLDPFMRALGFKGGITGPGEACLSVVVLPEHTNNWGSAHGGFLFALADSAFALAANSHGPLAVSLAAHIEHMKPCQVGDTLTAAAREINLTRRTGVYQVEISKAGVLIALFTGTVHRMSEQLSERTPRNNAGAS